MKYHDEFDPIYLSQKQFTKWDDYVARNYKDFYRNKIVYEAEKCGRGFNIIFKNEPYEHFDNLIAISQDKEVNYVAESK